MFCCPVLALRLLQAHASDPMRWEMPSLRVRLLTGGRSVGPVAIWIRRTVGCIGSRQVCEQAEDKFNPTAEHDDHMGTEAGGGWGRSDEIRRKDTLCSMDKREPALSTKNGYMRIAKHHHHTSPPAKYAGLTAHPKDPTTHKSTTRVPITANPRIRSPAMRHGRTSSVAQSSTTPSTALPGNQTLDGRPFRTARTTSLPPCHWPPQVAI